VRIFITGASGFIGGAIARRLAGTHFVTAMSRTDKSDHALLRLNVTPIRCELGKASAEHLKDVEAIVHCAAYVKQWGTRAEFWEANVSGTEQLLKMAKRSGVRRFIHIGTEAALFAGRPLRDIDETYPYPKSSPYLYSETKREAEKAVLAANGPGFATLSIRPRFVWGPGDQTILPVIATMVRTGRFRWIDGGRAKTSTTHIDNLVAGVALALTRGRGGEAYFITDEGTTTFREFLTALLKTQGLSPPDKSLGGGTARTLAAVSESIWRMAGLKSDPPITRFAAAMMAADCTLRIDKARRELGYEPVVARAAGLTALYN
jgi:nucleoside-diphosphate-sugar epimerase